MLFIFRDERQELPCRGHPHLLVASIVCLGPIRHVVIAKGTDTNWYLTRYLARREAVHGWVVHPLAIDD